MMITITVTGWVPETESGSETIKQLGREDIKRKLHACLYKTKRDCLSGLSTPPKAIRRKIVCEIRVEGV